MGEFALAILNSLVTAFLLALAAAAYNWWRGVNIENKLKTQFFPRSFVFSVPDLYGVTISNVNGVEIVVRLFELVGQKQFEFVGDKPSFIKAFLTMEFVESKSDLAVKKIDGWVVMPAHTKAVWFAPDVAADDLPDCFLGARVQIEYSTLLGDRKLVMIEPEYDALEQREVAKTFNYRYDRPKIEPQFTLVAGDNHNALAMQVSPKVTP